jgi:hypothetical protein
MNGEMEYEVGRILQSEIGTTHWKIGGKYKTLQSLYFLVKWKSYLNDESTWEPEMSLEHALESIEEFYTDNLEVPALITWGQVWKGGGAPVRDIRNISGYTYFYEHVTT